MSLYEAMFLMDNRQANRDWEGSLEKIKGMLTKHGGEIVRCEKWGERKLAYEIDGRRRGTYVLAFFNGTGTAANALYRECVLSDTILRVLIVKSDGIPPAEMLIAPDDIPLGRRGRDYGEDDRGGRFGPRRRDAAPTPEPVPEPEGEDEAEEAKK